MDASIGFSNWNSLDTMRTAFVFQAAISPLAFHLKGYIFNTTLCSFVDIKNFNLPVPIVSIATVHAKKLSSEKRCLITTGASLNGDNSVFLIHAIFGQQGYLRVLLAVPSSCSNLHIFAKGWQVYPSNPCAVSPNISSSIQFKTVSLIYK